MPVPWRTAAVVLRSTSHPRSSHITSRLAGRFHTAPSLLQTREDDQRKIKGPIAGLSTPAPPESQRQISKSAFYFEAGYAGWAKRHSRPFPPPFFSPPSGSFSDPLSTHDRSRDMRPKVNGVMIRGITNGDDALLVSDNLIGTNDGVGAWAQREGGHAPLWSRLMIHFFAVAAEEDAYGGDGEPDCVQYLDLAYERTKEALSEPNEWYGTTTAVSALMHSAGRGSKAMLFVTQLGDSKVLVVRPSLKEEDRILFSTTEQWHYFDCPRQLGTNSPDTPKANAILDMVEIQEDDIVLAMSDGVTDNLWEHEIAENVISSLREWYEARKKDKHVAAGAISDIVGNGALALGMRFVAHQLVLAAKTIAEDPFAESPFMEKAVEEGLAIEGGKLDDISVVAAICRRRKDQPAD